MNWRIRMNLALFNELKQYQILTSSSCQLNHLWKTTKIQFHLTNSTPNTHNFNQIMMNHSRLNIKRCLSKDTASIITVNKKQTFSSKSSNVVLVCGQNICGQLGLSTAIIERRKPQYLKIVNKSNMDENIQYVCAGGMHSCALTENGLVYTWGCNDDNALGRITNDIDEEFIPALLELPEEIKTLCAGDSFTVSLAKSGRAYISGCFRNSQGILGLFEYKQNAQQPVIIPFNQPIKQIACGADFCLLLTENGSIFAFQRQMIFFSKMHTIHFIEPFFKILI